MNYTKPIRVLDKKESEDDVKKEIKPSNPRDYKNFKQVGGLPDHIKLLKEMVIFPLLYGDIFTKFRIKPVRGVLFYGPPGTGKTLLAGALANECSKLKYERVTFFHRKASDILDKWIGESEQTLRELFRVAGERSPAIIFFDELDGLAPTRSQLQDHIHSSIVTTLLALMDGLDKQKGVVIIGATNRIDAIDSALRRPGRFDRELYFPLPKKSSRQEILDVHMQSWVNKPDIDFVTYLADLTEGYSGSDLQALCAETVMTCLRRTYPGIYTCPSKMNIRLRNLKVEDCDFLAARGVIIPAVHRMCTPSRRLSLTIQPLLKRQLDKIISLLKGRWPHFMETSFSYSMECARYAGRMLLIGNHLQGHNTHMAPGILHALEHLPVQVIDVQTLFANGCQAADEICIQKLTQARQNLPGIIMAYRVDQLWSIVEESTRAVLISILEDLHAGIPLLILATATESLPSKLQDFFNLHSSIVISMEDPTKEEKMEFLQSIFMERMYNICKNSKKDHDDSIIAKNPTIVNKVEGKPFEGKPFEGKPIERKTIERKTIEGKTIEGKSNEVKPGPSTVVENNPEDIKEFKRKCNTLEIIDPKKLKTVEEDCKTESPRKSPREEKNPTGISVKSKTCRKRLTSRKNLKTNTKSALSSVSNVWFPISTAINIAKRIQNSLTTLNSSSNDVETHYVNKNFPKNSSDKLNVKLSDSATQMKEETKKTKDPNKSSLLHAFCSNKNFSHGDSKEEKELGLNKVKALYKRTVNVTTKNMQFAVLELFYDTLDACIKENQTNPKKMLKGVEDILHSFENMTPSEMSVLKN